MVPECHYMPTSENPSEQGRRGAEPGNLGSLWFKGAIFGSAVQTNGHHNLKCAKPWTTVDYITKMGEAATSQRRREELQCGPTPTQVIHSTGSSSE